MRYGRDEQLIGPFDYGRADDYARYVSREEGLAELVTILGARPGDPETIKPSIKVDSIYIEGKQTLRGRAAEFHSKRKLLEDL